MGTIVLIVVGLLVASVVTLSSMILFEKLATIRKKKLINLIKSLKQNDAIEINHPAYDNQAIFKGLIYDDMHVIVFKNRVHHMNTILPTSMFIKKI